MASRSAASFSLVSILFLLVCSTTFLSIAFAVEYIVGDDLGWRTMPAATQDKDESYYTRWAARHTFNEGDRLIFNNIVQTGSVLHVNLGGYMDCNTTMPLKELKVEGSDTVSFELRDGGVYRFISSKVENCLAGQKMKLHVRMGIYRPPQFIIQKINRTPLQQHSDGEL